MTAELPAFQRYQQAFTAYLRDPAHQPLPADVAPERMAVYEEIVFNNLFESVSACFPIARKIIGKRTWRALVQTFLRHYSARDPLFRSIPHQFLHYLNQEKADLPPSLPPYFKSLCHYEWVELQVAACPAHNVQLKVMHEDDLANQRPLFTAAMQLLDYAYPVHRISARYQPELQSTHLLVYRSHDDQVQFMELNAVTHRLISLLQRETLTGQQALTQIAKELQHPQPERIIEFGLSLLADLRDRGVIIGTYS